MWTDLFYKKSFPDLVEVSVEITGKLSPAGEILESWPWGAPEGAARLDSLSSSPGASSIWHPTWHSTIASVWGPGDIWGPRQWHRVDRVDRRDARSCLIFNWNLSYEFISYPAMDQYLYIPFLGDEHPFTSYFDVHQGDRVLTHPHPTKRLFFLQGIFNLTRRTHHQSSGIQRGYTRHPETGNKSVTGTAVERRTSGCNLNGCVRKWGIRYTTKMAISMANWWWITEFWGTIFSDKSHNKWDFSCFFWYLKRDLCGCCLGVRGCSEQRDSPVMVILPPKPQAGMVLYWV